MRLPNSLGRLRSPRGPGALSKIFREKNFRKVFVRSREPRPAHRGFLHGCFKGLKCYKMRGARIFQFLRVRGDKREPKCEKKTLLEDQVSS